MRTSTALAAFLLFGVLQSIAVADGHARKARVATGAVVELAPSAKSDAEWAKQRPDFGELRPGNTR